MRSIRKRLAGAAALLLVLAPLTACAQGAPPSDAAAATAPIRALYVTGGGFHDFVAQEPIVTEGLAERLPIEWTVDHSAGTSTEVLIDRHSTTDWADEFDLVVYNMSFSHVVDPEWIDRIAHAHRDRGIPAVILHGATHSYRRSTTDSWKQLMGAESMRHDSQREFAIEAVDAEHPIIRDLPGDWGPGVDELYEIERTWPTMTPLLRAYSVESEAHHPVAWTNEFGSARVFVTTMGHNNRTMADPHYLDMVSRGALWALGRLD